MGAAVNEITIATMEAKANIVETPPFLTKTKGTFAFDAQC
jgi:hypothetical protein